jgi:hypothetical protein
MLDNMDVIKSHRNLMIFNAENGLEWYCFAMGKTQQECTVSYE